MPDMSPEEKARWFAEHGKNWVKSAIAPRKPPVEAQRLPYPWIDKEFSLSHPIEVSQLPREILFHGTSAKGLSLIADKGLCPVALTSVRGWQPSDPHGVYVDVSPVEAYLWGMEWPVVLAIYRRDIPISSKVYYDWNMPISSTKEEVKRRGQAYMIIAGGCIQPVYTLVNYQEGGKFKVKVELLSEALKSHERVGLVDRWQLARFDKELWSGYR